MSHAILAPSAGHRWLTCTASIPETLGAIDESSEYADDGTAAHTMASWCLSHRRDAKHYPDATIDVLNDDGTVRRTFKADDERKSYVQVYLDSIRDRMHEGALLLVEQQLDSGLQSLLYGPSIGTGDASIIAPQFRLLEAHDLKYGMGVKVFASWVCHDRTKAVGPVITLNKIDYELNVQLCIYMLGLINLAVALGYDVDSWQCRIVIHQPRLDAQSDADLSVYHLREWAKTAQATLDRVDAGESKYVPDEHACRWCPKKATCAALSQYVANTIASEFPPVPDMTEWGIGKALERLPLIEQWVKAVRAAGWAALNAGQKVPGWKLVAGRQGNRTWKNADIVEDIMKNRYRLNYEEMYDKPSLISPTEAERRMKKINPKRWEDLQEMIERKPGQLTLARDGDDRAGYSLDDEMAKV